MGVPGQGQNNTLIHEDGAGNFLFGVNLNSGSNFSGINSLTFTVDAIGLTTDDFHLLSTGSGTPAYFAAAVYNTSNTSCTGVIGADGGTTAISTNSGGNCSGGNTSVPEPGTLALFGTALAGLALFSVLNFKRLSEPNAGGGT